MTAPKFRPDGFAARDRVMPVPVRDELAVGALLSTESSPLAAPVAAGAKLAVKYAFCLGARVCGKAIPLALNSAPVTLTWVMVTRELPALITVTVFVAVAPSKTLPNRTGVGLTVS